MAEFVYIIESPSKEDLSLNRFESDLLRQAIELNGMDCIVQLVESKHDFEKSISERLRSAIDDKSPKDPILHISAHGDKEGIGLTNNEFITWDELRDYLLPISLHREWGLLLCMSSCNGIEAIKMAFTQKSGRYDVAYAIIGNSDKPTWSDTAVAYASFYHHILSKNAMLQDAVEAMRVASHNNHFQILLSFAERNDKISTRIN